MHHGRDVGAAALVILVSAGCAAAEPVADLSSVKNSQALELARKLANLSD